MVFKRREGASAISIDGRKEWACKFCSESKCVDEVALQAVLP